MLKLINAAVVIQWHISNVNVAKNFQSAEFFSTSSTHALLFSDTIQIKEMFRVYFCMEQRQQNCHGRYSKAWSMILALWKHSKLCSEFCDNTTATKLPWTLLQSMEYDTGFMEAFKTMF
jgi:hypothetical protein